MASIKLPTRTVPGIMYKACYIKADVASVNRYCTENNIGVHTFTQTAIPYSNDGGFYCQQYTGGTWVTSFDYVPVVNTIDY